MPSLPLSTGTVRVGLGEGSRPNDRSRVVGREGPRAAPVGCKRCCSESSASVRHSEGGNRSTSATGDPPRRWLRSRSPESHSRRLKSEQSTSPLTRHRKTGPYCLPRYSSRRKQRQGPDALTSASRVPSICLRVAASSALDRPSGRGFFIGTRTDATSGQARQRRFAFKAEVYEDRRWLIVDCAEVEVPPFAHGRAIRPIVMVGFYAKNRVYRAFL